MKFGAFVQKMHKTKTFIELDVLTMAFATVGTAEYQPLIETAKFQALRIAHAGGGLGKRTYTNSYEALDSNIKNGFKYFELDFTFASDDRLVCIHDWKINFKRTFGIETNRRLTLEEFEDLADKNTKYITCTLRSA